MIADGNRHLTTCSVAPNYQLDWEIELPGEPLVSTTQPGVIDILDSKGYFVSRHGDKKSSLTVVAQVEVSPVSVNCIATTILNPNVRFFSGRLTITVTCESIHATV